MVCSTARTRGTSWVRKRSVFAESGQDGEERLGAADFVAEILERVGQGMADGVTQRAQAEGVEERGQLVAHAHGAVLQVAVVETEPRIEDELLHPDPGCELDLAREELVHPGMGSASRLKSVTCRTCSPST